MRDLELNDLVTKLDEYLKKIARRKVQLGKLRHQRHQELLGNIPCR